MTLADTRKAERFTIAAVLPILNVDICWTVGGISDAVLGDITLIASIPAGGAIVFELAVVTAGSCSTLSPTPQLTGTGITAWVIAFLEC